MRPLVARNALVGPSTVKAPSPKSTPSRVPPRAVWAADESRIERFDRLAAQLAAPLTRRRQSNRATYLTCQSFFHWEAMFAGAPNDHPVVENAFAGVKSSTRFSAVVSTVVGMPSK